MARDPRFVRVSTRVLSAACVALVSTSAFAQQAPNTSGAPAQTRRDETPGRFRENGVATTTNIGGGNAPTTANGPVGELRGPTAPAPDVITGPIGPGDVARLMQSQMPRLRPCYENARTTHPQLAGRIEVRFTIGRDGHVTQAMANGLPEAPEVATCIADMLRQTTFPQPQGGSLQFIYPLTFQPPPVATPPRGARARAGARPPARTPASHH